MRNRTFMHTARSDSLLGTIRFISRHADTQVYGAILPKEMTNQTLLDSVAYKTYYAIALGAEPPKSRKSQKKSDSAISTKESPSKKKSAKAKKVAATKPKLTKKKAPGKANRGNSLNVLSEVSLSEAAQLKEATKRSKKDFHISQASGSGDGTDLELGVLDEQHLKTLGDNGEEDDDENDSEDKSDDGDYDDDGNDGNDGNGDDDDDANDFDIQEDDDTNDDDKETDKEEEKIDDEEMMDEEEDDDVTKELYNDVHVNLGNRDADMTDVDQGGKTDELVQSSFVSFDFTSKLLNLKNPSLVDNEIASLMDTTVHHEEPRSQTSSLYTILPQAVSDFATPVIEKNVTESLEAAVLARSSSQPKSIYEAAASLYEFELTKILIDKMEKNKSYDKADYKREIYDALVKSYQTNKDLFDTYGEVFTLNRSRDDKDKDQDPSAGSDRWKKRRKSSKEAESSKDSRQHVDFWPPQTWISQVARAKEPRTSFDELMDTSFDFSVFVLNRLNIKDLTQAILVGPAFDLLKGTCKSLTEL
ncbi:hypothetical protein Tco_1016856 [Tanacetum coccineum]|uniref:Uncharacterized protein n=1 Tax=Tanacetum coccineum TaxID=301880 RepID=A0ABQ5FPU3_9ASTR